MDRAEIIVRARLSEGETEAVAAIERLEFEGRRAAGIILGQRPVAALVYGSAKHIIDLYVWHGRSDPIAATASRNGYDTVHWSENGMEF